MMWGQLVVLPAAAMAAPAPATRTDTTR